MLASTLAFPTVPTLTVLLLTFPVLNFPVLHFQRSHASTDWRISRKTVTVVA